MEYVVECKGPTIITTIRCDSYDKAVIEFIDHIKMGYPRVRLRRDDGVVSAKFDREV